MSIQLKVLQVSRIYIILLLLLRFAFEYNSSCCCYSFMISNTNRKVVTSKIFRNSYSLSKSSLSALQQRQRQHWLTTTKRLSIGCQLFSGVDTVVGGNSYWNLPLLKNNKQLQKSTFVTSTSIMTSLVESNAEPITSTVDDDPYIWLENVESEESLQFAKESNDKCLSILGNPENENDNDVSTTSTYQRVLKVLESTDRIPMVSVFGYNNIDDNNNNEPILMNFWKDSLNPKGIWRRTTLQSYRTSTPIWETIIDLDQLAKDDNISWVWKGSIPLPRSRDNISATKKQVTRCLVQLSRGGSDAVHIREFDLITKQFVTDNEQPFIVKEGKTRISYKSRNVVYIGTDFGPGSLTDSGYPRTVREWVRGTVIDDAPIVMEGQITDVSVGLYISDQRIWSGSIYEIKYRSLTFYTSKYWIRIIQPTNLLAPYEQDTDVVVVPVPDFVEVQIQDDAEISFVGKMIFITLRSDWDPTNTGTVYKSGSVVYTDANTFITNGPLSCTYEILFTPTDRTAYMGMSTTKNYLIVTTMDNVKEQITFYKILSDGTGITKINLPTSTVNVDDHDDVLTATTIRSASCSPIDPYSGSDQFWFVADSYTTPSTLYLADASMVEIDNNTSIGKDNNDTNADNDIFIIEKLKSLPSQYDSSNLIVEQQFATSADGTSIPYFIVRAKDIQYDSTNPTLLYGYGGFEVSLGPKYIATAGLAWLERGGVYIEGNIRGGGEFGPSWHQAALQSNRNKAYEDFIAIAEHIISCNICSSSTLAIRGGSNVRFECLSHIDGFAPVFSFFFSSLHTLLTNTLLFFVMVSQGGLLMGNMYTMRPDLFGAIHCAVPLLYVCLFVCLFNRLLVRWDFIVVPCISMCILYSYLSTFFFSTTYALFFITEI
jgi:prolyl oligopeptidase